MSESELLHRTLVRAGQSQADRAAEPLSESYFPIDSSAPRALLREARALARHLYFYQSDPTAPAQDWSGYFAASDAELDALWESERGDVTPHIGLFAAFLELTGASRALLNSVATRHLDLQWKILGLVPRAALPDRAHLVLELKPGRASIEIDEQRRFVGGKDEAGNDLLYKPVRSTVIGQARIGALRSAYSDGTSLFAATVANSADGLGAPLASEYAGWLAFGHALLPKSAIGFACASSLLRLAGGERKIEVEFTLPDLGGAGLDPAQIRTAFQAELTGPAGWVVAPAVAAEVRGDRLILDVELPGSAPPVVPYDSKLHGPAFSTPEPIVRCSLREGSAIGHADLARLALHSARISVEVKGLANLELEGDLGPVSPKQPFRPFGPQPVLGSRFTVSSAEAFGKPLTDLTLRFDWLEPSIDLTARYEKYKTARNLVAGLQVDVQVRGVGLQATATRDVLLPPKSSGPTFLRPLVPRSSGSGKTKPGGGGKPTTSLGRSAPVPITVVSARPNAITLTLATDLLFEAYRSESVEHAVAQDRIVLNEPFVPTVREVRLDYRAQSSLAELDGKGVLGASAFAAADVEFFHVGAFGQVREHAHLREQSGLDDPTVRLFPAYPDQGEFLIGLSGVGSGDAANLLVSVLEGSADPTLPAPQVVWSILQANHWRQLGPRELVRDGTRNFTTSGIVELALPEQTDLEHTFMPSGLVWLKASLRTGSGGACRLLAVATNGVEVELEAEPNARGAGSAPAGTITRLLEPEAALKSLTQPAASYGGRSTETAPDLRKRATERLRHRNRAITLWDYERIVLEAFPELHRVKCVPHASDRSWLAPGHVRLVAVPKVRDAMVDPLAPTVSVDTLSRIEEVAQAHAGMSVKVWARSPSYRPVRVEFRVRFHTGRPFNHYRNETELALMRALSPWAFDVNRPVEFGSRVYRSALLDLVERLEWVDFVTDFRVGFADAQGRLLTDVSVLDPAAPDEILASARGHLIEPVLGS